MTESFREKTAASLPPHVRRRYAAEFEAMERFEILFDMTVDTWRRARRTLGKSCRAAARMFDHAARRLLLTR